MGGRDLSRREVQALTDAITKRGFDVDKLAEAAHITPGFMRQILFGEIRPSLEIRRSLAEALGIDPRGLE